MDQDQHTVNVVPTMAPVPIIDSHVHLFTGSDLDTLAWCSPSHPLASAHSLPEYLIATGRDPNLKGFILVESDHKHDLSSPSPAEGWKYPLQEVEYYSKIASSARDSASSPQCLAIIPWAPVPSGPKVLGEYLEACEKAAGDEWGCVKGFRYLLQDKEPGTMLKKSFIEGVRLLGRKGFVFEIGLDVHRKGKKQADEVVELIERVNEGIEEDDRPTFVINHLCKPNITIYNLTDPAFTNWRTTIYTLSKCSNTYIKLSGALSEMPDSLKNRNPEEIFEATFAWLGVVLATFGAERMMFGSDWPVCTVGVEAKDEEVGGAWKKWKGLVDRMCWMTTLEEERQMWIYGKTAAKAYGL